MSTPTPSPVPGTWKVISQVPGPGQDESGTLAQGYTITIQTGLGHTGKLFVPQDKYTAEQVRPRLAALAQTVDAIGQLEG